MVTDPTAPATRGDVANLLAMMKQWREGQEMKTQQWKEELRKDALRWQEESRKWREDRQKELKRWKDELHGDMEEWKDEFHGGMREWKIELRRHFDVSMEQFRHDFVGAKQDEIVVLTNARTDHEKRIRKLEKVTGVAV